MEISNISSRRIKIGKLKETYEFVLPEEFYIPQLYSAEEFVDSELKNLFDDPEVYKQLKHDCKYVYYYFYFI